jgi:hypothetical protein
MTKPVIKSHILRDYRLEGWKEKIAGRWHYRDLAADPQWRDGWISFDALTFNPHDGNVYCGLNSIDGDLLYRFEPANQRFVGLETKRWTDAFDSKIHRTLVLNPQDDCFYFATSLLHDADQQREAPGGKLVCYDWRRDEYSVLAIPYPHLYVQSIAMDAARGIIYGFTYPAEFVFRYDIASAETKVLGYVGNAVMFAQPHNAVVDCHGWLWGTYAETRAWDEVTSTCPIRLFKYHPDEDRFVWFNHGLSRRASSDQLLPDPDAASQAMPDMTESRHRQDYGFCDSMAYDGGRTIYAGTVAGVLCRIDIESGEVEKIATVMQAGRLPALSFDRHGRLYGGGGMKGQTTICRFDPQSEKLELWPDIVDEASGERPARIHELCVVDDGTVYLAENDNHSRSSYLWSMQL